MIRKIEQGILVCYPLQFVFLLCKSDCGELVWAAQSLQIGRFFLRNHENGERIRSRRR